MSDGKEMCLNLHVYTDDPSIAAKVSEVFTRTATGLLLDGIESNVRLAIVDFSDEDEEVSP